MKVKFLKDTQYENEGRRKGPVYEKDSVHDFPDDFAHKWIRRGVAVAVDGRGHAALRAVAREADGRKPGESTAATAAAGNREK